MASRHVKAQPKLSPSGKHFAAHFVDVARSGRIGETAQAILGHSDLETTLNTYMHAIPDSQRRAVERVAGVLFPDVPN